MTSLSYHSMAAYWSAPEVAANIIVFLNPLGALLLGLIVGYERSYHGRAAGMRTYGLVCMASAALTVIVGYPAYWYGGHSDLVPTSDPTRVIQGIVTGIGFLGAGVIMKEGFNISGLTTAASIWASSAIGILVGVGFYVAAILLTILSAGSMMWISRVEGWLPSRHVVMRLPSSCASARISRRAKTSCVARRSNGATRLPAGALLSASRTGNQNGDSSRLHMARHPHQFQNLQEN